MNKKILIVAIASTFAINAFAGTCRVKHEPQPEPVDTFEAYYKSAEGLTGNSLKAELNKIISKDHKKFSYSGVWDALKFTDEDPSNPSNVLLMYSGESVSKDRNGGGKYDWNREHTYPKSQGGFKSESAYAHTDIHHLRPTYTLLNSLRGSLEFDEGGSPTKYYPEAGNKRSSSTFEPRDEVKGDVARMMFYMATRYEGNDPITPDLELSPRVSGNGTALGNVCTLLKWHSQDPVNEYEFNRNTKIHTLQGNRNPYVDHPEWAEELFRDDCY